MALWVLGILGEGVSSICEQSLHVCGNVFDGGILDVLEMTSNIDQDLSGLVWMESSCSFMACLNLHQTEDHSKILACDSKRVRVQ